MVTSPPLAHVLQLLTRRNTLSGRLYSEDPCILGWDLANEPINRGDDSGEVLTAWLAGGSFNT